MQDPEIQPATPVDWRAKLIADFNLVPAEGATEVTDEQIASSLSSLQASAASVADLQSQSSDAATRLQELQTQYDQVTADLDAKSRELGDLYRAKTEAEVDAILEQYAGRIATPAAKDRIKALLLSDRESAMEILEGMPEPAAAPAEGAPPEPVHNPGQQQGQMSEQDKLAKQNELIAQIRKEKRGDATPFATYEAARNEARRRQPDLFQ
jgi:F0F1-type ATP synthase membrane subunit b/b'